MIESALKGQRGVSTLAPAIIAGPPSPREGLG